MIGLRGIIGKPWAVPCDGVSNFDCWELAIRVREHFGRSTPLYIPQQERTRDGLTDAMNENLTDWVQLNDPEPGCLVTFGNPAVHCGVMLDMVDVMHCWKSGVQVHNMAITKRVFGSIRFWELTT